MAIDTPVEPLDPYPGEPYIYEQTITLSIKYQGGPSPAEWSWQDMLADKLDDGETVRVLAAMEPSWALPDSTD